jgi:hypothetical protein
MNWWVIICLAGRDDSLLLVKSKMHSLSSADTMTLKYPDEVARRAADKLGV